MPKTVGALQANCDLDFARVNDEVVPKTFTARWPVSLQPRSDRFARTFAEAAGVSEARAVGEGN